GDARDRSAAHQPVPQPDQEFVAGGGDRLSRPVCGIRGHDAEPDGAGDRDHRHHHGRVPRDLARHQRADELVQRPHAADGALSMTEATGAYVRSQFHPPLPSPVAGAGPIAWLRANLFNSWFNVLLTLACLLLLWLIVPPVLRFLILDAVWAGSGRDDCLAETVGRSVGACWPFITAKFRQLIYGFYPWEEQWRVNLVYGLGAALLLPLLVPAAPYKALNAVLFFGVYPVLSFV